MSGLDLRTIAMALGGEVTGRQVLAPGPNHSRNDRSMSVWVDDDAPGGFRAHSHVEDPFTMCRDYVAEKLGLPHDYWRKGAKRSSNAPSFQSREPRPVQNDRWRIDRAIDIWRGSRDAQGTIVETYLASRGLNLPDNAADVLRFHPQCLGATR